MATDDKAYKCEPKLFNSSSWDDFRTKNDPKSIVVQACETVTGKGYNVTLVVLPPGVKPISALSQVKGTAKAEGYFDKTPIREKAPVTTPGNWPTVVCCNDWVALVTVDIDTNIVLPSNAKLSTQEAYVVGVGPGVASNGVRVPSQLQYGDKVIYSGNIAYQSVLKDKDGKGFTVSFIGEKNIIYKPQ